jgi:hypothetical protein
LEFGGAHLIRGGLSNDYSGGPGGFAACCDHDLRGYRFLQEGIISDSVREVKEQSVRSCSQALGSMPILSFDLSRILFRPSARAVGPLGRIVAVADLGPRRSAASQSATWALHGTLIDAEPTLVPKTRSHLTATSSLRDFWQAVSRSMDETRAKVMPGRAKAEALILAVGETTDCAGFMLNAKRWSFAAVKLKLRAEVFRLSRAAVCETDFDER